jgi:exopolysaccharide biosynthesis protein
MIKKNQILFLFFILTYSLASGQNTDLLKKNRKIPGDLIEFQQIKTDSLFDSHQIISLLTVQKNHFNSLHFEFGYSQSDLRTTSWFAKSKNAIAAINGSFFDVDKGGSVTYFELFDSVISRTRPSDLKWAKPNNLMNGAIIITNKLKVTIKPVKSDHFYERSKKEAGVLVSGPLLLYNSKKMGLPNVDFVNKRHPRTCLCETKESLVFITIDGRSEDAVGMNLIEAQKYLQNLGCVDAINLDGGGSTTMWTNDRGIVNFPSDKTGERPVANVLLITNGN